MLPWHNSRFSTATNSLKKFLSEQGFVKWREYACFLEVVGKRGRDQFPRDAIFQMP